MKTFPTCGLFVIPQSFGRLSQRTLTPLQPNDQYNFNPFLQEHAKLSKLAIVPTVLFPDGTVMQVGSGLVFDSIGLGVYCTHEYHSIVVPVG